jgi:hypothetical protein
VGDRQSFRLDIPPGDGCCSIYKLCLQHGLVYANGNKAGRVFVLIFLWEKDVARSTNCVYDTARFIIGEDSKSNVVAVILGCHESVVVRITKRVRARML